MHVVIRVSGYSLSFRNDKSVCVCVCVRSLSGIEIRIWFVFFCSYNSHAHM